MIEKLTLALSWVKNGLIKLYNFLGLPNRTEIRTALISFSPRNRMFLGIIGIIFIISSALLFWRLNNSVVVTVAIPGGSLTEGVIGSPRFINPLLAISDTDRDLVMLTYSGLMRVGTDGKLIPDLAKSYTVSKDGLVYRFILKDKIYWHDGQPITADDIVFTIKRANDPQVKSPKRADWDGVEVRKISEREVEFILKRPYSYFLENTTMGILPEHLWSKVSIESFSLNKLNTEPVGSGPYKFSSTKKDSLDVIQTYNLTAFGDFALGEPHLKNVTIRSYSNTDELFADYSLGKIDSFGAVSPEKAKGFDQNKIAKIPLPRIFSIFFNQNQNRIFTSKEVRQALDLATDKKAIVAKVLAGYGEVADNAIPPSSFGFTLEGSDSHYDPQAAKDLLAKAGWKLGTNGILQKKISISKKETRLESLSFSIFTSDVPELKAVAEMVREQWSKIGAKVEVRIFEAGDLNENFIRPRKYDALLFGEVVGRHPDPFPFWHSSQRLDPGLNIAQYTNVTADKLLEEARSATDEKTKLTKYRLFQKEIAKDQPAVFLYSPYYLYLLSNDIKGAKFPAITNPAERFASIHLWYNKTDRLWRFLANKNNIIKK
ncbi:MAG: ABC transporter substrate-binding protein [Candidatus Paceibacterota bacterium]